MPEFIRWFDQITLGDLPLVGGKNASLGEMYRELGAQGVKVPNGFAITAQAYWHVLDSAGIREKLQTLLAGLDKRDVADLARRGHEARDLIRGAGIPADLWNEISTAYEQLGAQYAGRADVAVRSSATAEDLPGASFAGQQETYLNIRGRAALREACSKCFASLFTDRAISYRVDQGFDHFQVGLSIGVQTMVRSDLASSGVLFTLDTETGFRDVVFITGAYGLGENIVQGSVDPDEFYVFKPTLRDGHRPILRRRLGAKQLRMIYVEGRVGASTRNKPVPEQERQRFCISDDEVLQLADYAIKIEQHYGRKAGSDQPMDIEWAKDGISGELFIVQARPETVQSLRHANQLENYILEERGELLAQGKSVGQRIGAGQVRIITDLDRLHDFQPGEVLVADTTTPDWEPVMKQAAAIVTNRGGRTCHAAIVARELGIPAVVGAKGATQALKPNEAITVSCAEGDTGNVYRGQLKFHVERLELKDTRRPRTKIMMNLAEPDQAFNLSFIPNDGVGLARMEFIINNSIKIHPMALVHPERVTDQAARSKIEQLTAGYADKSEYFVTRLAEGVGTIAAAFYPKPVIVRLSDFKSNEYATLIGGDVFEPKEENPMLGFRGAARYTHPAYAEGFALECKALRRVREEMGLSNVRIMVPFCRRVEEAERVIAALTEHGLKRGEHGLEIYVMCEVPNNVLRIDDFARLFDGFSIGSNDLTQLVLGVDRDSALVAFEFDERDPGVLEMLRMTIAGAKRNQRHSGICGQAPSDYPEIVKFLVQQGIDSISLNPDAVLKTTLKVLELEAAQGGPQN
ncbi:MAG TPA: phosphoenolpyruvate synthase [Gammaproteobacteria bacterium]|nr:phosphoenolpyruvate synthase [Gammaproteobacteria bacterium]